MRFVDFCRTQLRAGNIRMAPFLVILYGKTGVGKSNLQQQIPKALARLNQLDETSSGVYDWMPNANFQHLSHQHWCVRMDDPGHGVAPPMAGVRNEVEEVVAIVNNAPYPVEQADVTMKGKVFAFPSLMLVSTNYYTMRVEALCRYPPAFWRRVSVHVEVFVKPEYCVDGGATLDPIKASEAGTHDLHFCHVRYFDASKAAEDGIKQVCLTEPIVMTFPELMTDLQNRYSYHMKQQRELVLRATYRGNWCPICGLDSSRDCGHFAAGEVDMMTKELIMRVKTHRTLEAFEQEGIEEKSENPSHLKLQGGYLAAGVVAVTGVFSLVNAYSIRKKFLEEFKPIHPLPVRREEVVDTSRWDDLRRYMKQHVAEFSVAAVVVIGSSLGLLSLFGSTIVLYQARANNATEGLTPMTWTRAEQTFRPGVPPPASAASTFTKDDLIKSLADSFVQVKGECQVGGYLLGFNSILTASHAVKVGNVVTVQCRNRTISFKITESNFRVLPSNREICVIRNGEIFGAGSIIGKLWLAVDEQVQQFDEVEIWSDKCDYSPKINQMKIRGATRVLTTSAQTIDGSCGSAYVARFGSAWKVVAMHYALEEHVTVTGLKYNTVAALVTQLELKRVVESMGTTLQGVVTIEDTMTKSNEPISCSHFQLKSELWAAMSHHGAEPYPLGEMTPSLAGSTLRSKIVPSLMYEAVSARFEEEWCGHTGYWKVPDFRGRMVDGKWSSLWTNAFSSENRVQPNELLLIAALADYLHGMDALYTEGFSSLSEEQILTGIAGSYVNRINIKTSVGPPFNRGKRAYVFLEEMNSHLAPEIWEMFDHIEEVLEQGQIPSVLGLCTGKDEPIKPGKFPRVFINLPFAFNMHLKQKGVWKSFVRANMQFFESAVGINMTSAECNKIVSFLQSVDAALEGLTDGDVRSLDKSWSGPLWDFVALIIYAISWVIGVEPMKNYLLALGLKFTTFSMKNDLFRTHWNPSGNDWTVELNGFLMSLGERVIWYLHHFDTIDVPKLQAWFNTFFENPIPPDCGFTFRKKVALLTYGDDNVKNSKERLPATYCQDWLDQLGMVVTDAGKTGEMKPVALSELQFLKRNLIWDEELKTYLPPLSKKSIARMLLMKRDSTLSDLDHAAVVSSEALREAVYHGREFYRDLRVFLIGQALALGFFHNPYFISKEFEFWRMKIAEGSFQTWSNREPVAPVAMDSDLVVPLEGLGPLRTNFVLQGKMSTPSIVNAGNDPATNSEKVSASASGITHDTGSIDFSSPGVTSATNGVQQFHQQMPQNTLDDFMLRATEVTSFTMSDTDLQGVLTTIDPWALYLANSRIADKIANYQLVRGTLQIIFVCAVPGNAFGSYVISALPNGGDIVNGVANNLSIYNVMQVDHYVRIDCASAEDGALQLEFCWPFDFAQLPTGPANSWKLSFSCLSPIATAIPGGLVSGSIRVFVSLMDDYELVVPHIQGKPLQPNHAIKHVAPKLHDKISAASAAAGKIESIAKKAEGIPIIGPYAGTVEKAAGLAKKAFGWLGFTRHYEEEALSRVLLRPNSSLAHYEGLDASDSASLACINEISTDPLLVGVNNQDPLAFASLFARWTLVKTFTWDGASGPGATLGTLPVTPMLGVGDNTTANLGPAGYIGTQFTYWRGDMEFLIVIPVSKLHRGNLQIAWLPVGSSVVNPITNATLNTIYDVTSGDEKQLIVGYARDVPFCTTNIVTNATTIVPYGATNGRLVFNVITPLVSPNPDATHVDVLVFSRARPNMEFAVPNEYCVYNNSTGLGLQNYVLSTNVYLQGASGDEDSHAPSSVTLVSESGTYPMEEILFGERIESCRAMMQKPCRLPITKPNVTVGAANGAAWLFSQLGTLPTASGDPTAFTPATATWQQWCRVLFTGIACSERYKVLCNSTTLSGTVGPISTASGLTIVGPTLPNTVSVGVGAVNGCYEGQIPYYCGRKFLLGREVDHINTLLTHRSKVGVAVAVPVQCVLYHSYGSDIRVTGFRQVPVIKFRETAYPNVPFFSY